MARKAGQITIDLNAGTAKFLVDMDTANAKIGQFGGAHKRAVSDVKATSAAIKALEGGFADNSKAATAFIAKILGGGPLLQAAFPVIGAVAFGGVLVEIGTRAAKFFRDMQQAPERVAAAFRELNAPLKQTNDELALTNARLENDIAKLEGKRQNTLQVALAEARVEADKLAESLEKNLGSLDKLLKENSVGIWQQMFGKAQTDDIKKLFGGETGSGGLRGSVATLMDQYRGRLDGAHTPADRSAIEADLNTRLSRLYQAALDQVNAKLHQVPGVSITGAALGAMGVPTSALQDNRVRVEELQAAARVLQEEMARVALTSQGSALKEKKTALEAGLSNAKLDRPFDERMKAIGVEIEGLQAKLAGVGQSEGTKALLKGFGEARKAIEEVDKQLAHINPNLKLTEAQMGALSKLYIVDKPKLELQTAWQTKVEHATDSLLEQTTAVRMLSAAIGAGYEAERRAAIETQVLGRAGLDDYNDPTKASDVARLRAAVTSEYDAKRAQSSATAVDGLQRELQAQELLTQAQYAGEQAIRQLGAMAIWRSGIEKGLTGQQIAAEISLYYAKLRTQEAAGIAKLQAETTMTEKLTAARLQGAEALRKQSLENKYAEMDRLGHGGLVAATRVQDDAARQDELTTAVAARLNVYGDQAEKLEQERAKLVEIIGAHRATTDQARVLRDLQRERLRLWVQEQLEIGTAKAGVRAFFAEMQAGSKKTSEIVYQNLVGAVDRVSDELAKALTGQQTNFGKMLQEMGQSATRDAVKAGMEKGLGALGKAFGITMPEAKPDGTSAKPYHVIVDNGNGGTDQASDVLGSGSAKKSGIAGLLGAGIGALGGLLKGLFSGGGGGGESVTSSVSYMASGGPVSPSQAYIVGDAGPELLTRTSGHITSNAELRRTFGGNRGGDSYVSVDARGAEIGAERRVYRAIAAAQRASVSTAVRAQHERSQRVPQRASA
jgi:hypothetical protein